MSAVPAASGEAGGDLVRRLPTPEDRAAAARATLAVELLAVDPLLGAFLVGPHSPARTAWLEAVEARATTAGPVRRLPVGADAGRVLGGLDLPATLAAGRRVFSSGLLAASDGGLLIVPRAEALDPALAAEIAGALDTGRLQVERDGISRETTARFGLLVLAEGMAGGEAPWAGLLDRVGLLLTVPPRWRPPLDADVKRMDEARRRLTGVEVSPAMIEALCEVGWRCGIGSLRPPLHAARTAAAHAALQGRDRVELPDLEVAAELTLVPRGALPEAGAEETADADEGVDAGSPEARPDPVSPAEPATPPARAERRNCEVLQSRLAEPPGSRRDERRPDGDPPPNVGMGPLADRVLAAVRVALSPELLAAAASARSASASRDGRSGRDGGRQRDPRYGRPVGVRPGDPRSPSDIDVLASVRAAAPWQRVRRPTGSERRLVVRKEDLRLKVRERRSGTLTVFAVDASGSQTLHRLAETKGAVEHLLAAGYARRDRVALVAFRGSRARVVLPPTRALARARRELAGLAGGGATPLAGGIEAASRLALGARREGLAATVVLLTDGRANIDLAGTPDRDAARKDALAAARRLRRDGLAAVVIDTSRRGSEFAARLAREMNAEHVRLPVPRARELGALARRVARDAAPV